MAKPFLGVQGVTPAQPLFSAVMERHGGKQAWEPEISVLKSWLCPLAAVYFLSFLSLEQTEHIYAYLEELF